jgi:rhodanese-related sulfurtransferase
MKRKGQAQWKGSLKKLLLFLISSMVLLFALGCISETEAQAKPDYSDQEVLEKLINSPRDDYYLVDVRTPEEYVSGHIPKAENIPVSTIAENPPTSDKDALIIVYCRSGSRSARAKSILEEMGYTDVHNFGGILDWSGRVVKGEEEQQ